MNIGPLPLPIGPVIFFAIAIALAGPVATANGFALAKAAHNASHPVLSKPADWNRADLSSPSATGINSDMRFGVIESTLHDALAHAELPSGVSAEIERVFAQRLNFDAPARAGDRYRIAYERTGGADFAVDHYRVTAIELRLQGHAISAAWFAPARQSSGAYFSFDGESIAAAPFAMPVDGARVSSPFGMRIRPDGELREHTGVDLAAPVGTPVKAAAPGTVQFTGFDKGGYGRYVVLQHAAGYSTWYAHLSTIAAHLRAGVQLRLGQRLGAVGRTGDATGPHLHFEVRYNHEPTDPLPLIRSRIAPALAGSDLVAFERQIAAVQQAFNVGLPQTH